MVNTIMTFNTYGDDGKLDGKTIDVEIGVGMKTATPNQIMHFKLIQPGIATPIEFNLSGQDAGVYFGIIEDTINDNNLPNVPR